MFKDLAESFLKIRLMAFCVTFAFLVSVGMADYIFEISPTVYWGLGGILAVMLLILALIIALTYILNLVEVTDF